MEATSWWHERIVSGLGSYWVYQHLGNLSPAERAQDELWQRIAAWDGTDELDITETLDKFAERVDQEPETYRWSYARDFDDVRLVVVDSRAARVLTPGHRSILDDTEMAWLDEQMQGGFRHLLVGTSLPFLLSPACTTSRRGTRRWSTAPGAGSGPGSASTSGRSWTSSTGRRSSAGSRRSRRWRCRWRTASAGPPRRR